MTEKNKKIDLRLRLEPDDPLYEDFLEIKELSGLKNHSEVLRFILRLVSKISPKKNTESTFLNQLS